MVRGAVQLPPGGEAIVLGPDHATVGGYPVPAVVVAADLHRLAHVRPGDTVTWAVVDGDEAQSARRALERTLDSAVHGWFPTRAG
jgi:allophanate hydrolase subunit 2